MLLIVLRQWRLVRCNAAAVADRDDRRSERFLSRGKFSVVYVRDSSLLRAL